MSALGKKGGVKSASLLAVLLTMLLALVGVGSATAAFATGGSSTTPISAKALDSHECNSSEWHFVITQVASETQAPASISVEFANGKTVSVSLDKVTGGTAHYATTQYLDSKVVSATTDIYEGWSGQFNLSHGPCGSTPPTKTPVTAVNGMFVDLCGTEFNLEFRSTPTQGVAYLQHREGNTITVTAQVTDDSKYVLTNPDWSQSATDTLTPCESELTQVTAVNGTFTDKCGTEFNLEFTPTPTEGVKYIEVREGNTLTVHAEVTDTDKYELTNPDWTQSKTDELVKCEVEKTPVTAVNGMFVDLCGTEFNLEFRSTPTQGVAYLQHREGNTITVTAQVTDDSKYVLTNPDWSQSATDTLTPCEESPTEIPVPTVPVIDECGPGNAHYGDVPSGNYTVVRNEDGSITLTAKDGYVFPEGKESVTLPKPTETNTAPCPVIAPTASLSSECEILDGAKTGYTVVNAVLDNTGSNEEVTFEVAETIDGVTNLYPIPVAAGEKLTPQVFYSQEDGKKVSLVINARDAALANLSFETATCAATVTPPPPPPTKTCPAGTKWVDLNANGKVDAGECKTPDKPKPPVKPQFKCPSGMTGSDLNHNGKVDAGECKTPVKQRGIGANTGIDDPAVSQTSGFAGLPLGAAIVALTGMLGFALVLRRRPQPRHARVRD